MLGDESVDVGNGGAGVKRLENYQLEDYVSADNKSLGNYVSAPESIAPDVSGSKGAR